jgi:predicted neutral ceramidase superfamily lipid hydrolase
MDNGVVAVAWILSMVLSISLGVYKRRIGLSVLLSLLLGVIGLIIMLFVPRKQN